MKSASTPDLSFALAVVLVVSACATKEAPPAPPMTAPAAVAASPRTAPFASVAPRRPLIQATVVPGSMRDFELNVGDRVFFAFDTPKLDDSGRATLQKQAAWLERYPTVTVTVQGNCDERGTREYNLALGARRAESVKDYLLSLGVAAGRVSTISFGKERPVCVESNETCWAQNRRAVSAITNAASPNVAMRY
jgi:peptidoglycan-associated lipoprotein